MLFVDILFAITLAYALYNGLKNGLFVELASFFSLLIGIYVAIKFSSFIRTILESWFSWNPKHIQIIAFILTFLLVIIGIQMAAKLFSNMANFAYLGWLNKLSGALLSILKTVLILSVLIGFVEKINFNNWLLSQKTKENSLFFHPVQETAQFVYPSLNECYDFVKEEVSIENKECDSSIKK